MTRALTVIRGVEPSVRVDYHGPSTHGPKREPGYFQVSAPDGNDCGHRHRTRRGADRCLRAMTGVAS